ncbi:MAG TPA: flagellar hook-basal body complex protein FliE [Gemmatimonadales bacterium]
MTSPISAMQRIHNAAQASAHRAIQEAALRGGGDGVSVPFTSPDGAPSFADTLKNAIGEVSAAQEHSAAMTDAFVRGENVELHQVMAAAEEASLSLELLVEVRNKFTEAYRTVINMQG